jgi:hypothetical protein
MNVTRKESGMSIFSNAKKIESQPKTSAKKDDKAKIALTGLENYAAIDTVLKGFKAIMETVGESVKGDMNSIFVGIGKQLKARPDNFRGIDGKASASCELRNRASSSPLSPEEVELLSKNEIPVGSIVTKEAAYIINPTYFNDSALLEKVSKALEKVAGLPADFILVQEKEEKKVVTDETVSKVFEKGLSELLLPIVTVPAIKPTYTGTLVEALEAAKSLAGLVDAEAEKKAKKAKG